MDIFSYTQEIIDYIKSEGYLCKNHKKSLEKRNIKFTIDQWIIFKNFRDITGKKYDSSSKEFFIARYGEEHWEKLYDEKQNKVLQSLDNFIKRYGKDDGPIRWEQFKNNISYKNSIQYFIDEYGEIRGQEEWKKYCIIKGFNKEKYISDHGNEAWETLKKTRAHTEEIYIQRYGETLGKEKWELYKANCFCMYGKDSKPNQLAYWERLGYNTDDAKLLVSQRQQTFTLDKCIEKYGIEGGTERWNKRQELWQTTLKNKSLEETKEMNIKKGLCSDGTPQKGGLFSVEEINRRFQDKGGYLYYIKLYDNAGEYWKIGITSNNRGVKGRLGATYFNRYDVEIIFEIYFDNYSDAFVIEQSVLNNFSDKRISGMFNSTEIFCENILEGKSENEVKNRIW